jgi:hypothetical protein
MQTFGWRIRFERFADGGSRWYATRPDQPVPLTAPSHAELLTKIWQLDFAQRAVA